MRVISHPKIIVTGMSGVGKTHLLVPIHEDPSLKVVGFGVEMQAATQKLMGDGNVELSKLPLEVRQTIQSKVSRRIEDLAEEAPIIIDGHLLVEQSNNGFRVPGFPAAGFDRLKLSAIILITDSCERIQQRRQGKQKYQDLKNDLDFLESFQEDVRRACVAYSILFGCFLVEFNLAGYADLQSDPTWTEQRRALKAEIVAVLKAL